MTAEDIRANYKELHDLLSESYYSFHNLSKKAFDTQHGKIWNDLEAELIAKGYEQPPEPDRDYGAEIATLKTKVEALEKK